VLAIDECRRLLSACVDDDSKNPIMALKGKLARCVLATFVGCVAAIPKLLAQPALPCDVDLIELNMSELTGLKGEVAYDSAQVCSRSDTLGLVISTPGIQCDPNASLTLHKLTIEIPAGYLPGGYISVTGSSFGIYPASHYTLNVLPSGDVQFCFTNVSTSASNVVQVHFDLLPTCGYQTDPNGIPAYHLIYERPNTSLNQIDLIGQVDLFTGTFQAFLNFASVKTTPEMAIPGDEVCREVIITQNGQFSQLDSFAFTDDYTVPYATIESFMVEIVEDGLATGVFIDALPYLVDDSDKLLLELPASIFGGTDGTYGEDDGVILNYCMKVQCPAGTNTSNLEVSYGCYGESCQSDQTTEAVVVNFDGAPYLLPTKSFVVSPDYCTTPSQWKYEIKNYGFEVNPGEAAARNVLMTVFFYKTENCQALSYGNFSVNGIPIVPLQINSDSAVFDISAALMDAKIDVGESVVFTMDVLANPNLNVANCEAIPVDLPQCQDPYITLRYDDLCETDFYGIFFHYEEGYQYPFTVPQMSLTSSRFIVPGYDHEGTWRIELKNSTFSFNSYATMDSIQVLVKKPKCGFFSLVNFRYGDDTTSMSTVNPMNMDSVSNADFIIILLPVSLQDQENYYLAFDVQVSCLNENDLNPCYHPLRSCMQPDIKVLYKNCAGHRYRSGIAYPEKMGDYSLTPDGGAHRFDVGCTPQRIRYNYRYIYSGLECENERVYLQVIFPPNLEFKTAAEGGGTIASGVNGLVYNDYDWDGDTLLIYGGTIHNGYPPADLFFEFVSHIVCATPYHFEFNVIYECPGGCTFKRSCDVLDLNCGCAPDDIPPVCYDLCLKNTSYSLTRTSVGEKDSVSMNPGLASPVNYGLPCDTFLLKASALVTSELVAPRACDSIRQITFNFSPGAHLEFLGNPSFVIYDHETGSYIPISCVAPDYSASTGGPTHQFTFSDTCGPEVFLLSGGDSIFFRANYKVKASVEDLPCASNFQQNNTAAWFSGQYFKTNNEVSQCGQRIPGTYFVGNYRARMASTISFGEDCAATARLTVNEVCSTRKVFGDFRPQYIVDSIVYTFSGINFDYIPNSAVITNKGHLPNISYAIPDANVQVMPGIGTSTLIFRNDGLWPLEEIRDFDDSLFVLDFNLDFDECFDYNNNVQYTAQVYYHRGSGGCGPKALNGSGQVMLLTPPGVIFNYLSSPLVTIPNDTILWEVRVGKTPAAGISYLALATGSSPVNVFKIYDLSNGVDITSLFQPYPGGIWFKNGTDTYRDFAICATTNSCAPVQLDAYAGWSCDEYPVDPQTGLFDNGRSCVSKYLPLRALRANAGIQASFTKQPEEGFPLCEEVEFEIAIKNVGVASTFEQLLDIYLPLSGAQFVPGSFELAYPSINPPPSNPGALTGTYVSIPDPSGPMPTSFGQKYQFELGDASIQSLLPINWLNGMGISELPGVTLPENNLNTISLRWRVIFNCDYISGGRLKMQASAVDRCDRPLEDQLTSTNLLAIEGLDPRDFNQYAIAILNPQIGACSGQQRLTVNVVGVPNDIQENEFICVTFPPEIQYVPGSADGFSPASNVAPYFWDLATEQVTDLGGGVKEICWRLPEGYPGGGIVAFNINVIVDDDAECGEYRLSALTKARDTVYCVADDIDCPAEISTSATTETILDIIPGLQIVSNAMDVLLSCSPNPGLIAVSGQVTIQNLFIAIPPGTPIPYLIFEDANLNALYDPGEELFSTTYTGGIVETGFAQLPFNFEATPAQVCNLYALVGSQSCHCAPPPQALRSGLETDFLPTSLGICENRDLELFCGTAYPLTNVQWSGSGSEYITGNVFNGPAGKYQITAEFNFGECSFEETIELDIVECPCTMSLQALAGPCDAGNYYVQAILQYANPGSAGFSYSVNGGPSSTVAYDGSGNQSFLIGPLTTTDPLTILVSDVQFPDCTASLLLEGKDCTLRYCEMEVTAATTDCDVLTDSLKVQFTVVATNAGTTGFYYSLNGSAPVLQPYHPSGFTVLEFPTATDGSLWTLSVYDADSTGCGSYAEIRLPITCRLISCDVGDFEIGAVPPICVDSVAEIRLSQVICGYRVTMTRPPSPPAFMVFGCEKQDLVINDVIVNGVSLNLQDIVLSDYCEQQGNQEWMRKLAEQIQKFLSPVCMINKESGIRYTDQPYVTIEPAMGGERLPTSFIAYLSIKGEYMCCDQPPITVVFEMTKMGGKESVYYTLTIDPGANSENFIYEYNDPPAYYLYNWKTDGGTVVSGGGGSGISLSWPTPGIKEVCVCVSDPLAGPECPPVEFCRQILVDQDTLNATVSVFPSLTCDDTGRVEIAFEVPDDLEEVIICNEAGDTVYSSNARRCPGLYVDPNLYVSKKDANGFYLEKLNFGVTKVSIFGGRGYASYGHFPGDEPVVYVDPFDPDILRIRPDLVDNCYHEILYPQLDWESADLKPLLESVVDFLSAAGLPDLVDYNCENNLFGLSPFIMCGGNYRLLIDPLYDYVVIRVRVDEKTEANLVFYQDEQYISLENVVVENLPSGNYSIKLRGFCGKVDTLHFVMPPAPDPDLITNVILQAPTGCDQKNGSVSVDVSMQGAILSITLCDDGGNEIGGEYFKEATLSATVTISDLPPGRYVVKVNTACRDTAILVSLNSAEDTLHFSNFIVSPYTDCVANDAFIDFDITTSVPIDSVVVSGPGGYLYFAGGLASGASPANWLTESIALGPPLLWGSYHIAIYTECYFLDTTVLIPQPRPLAAIGLQCTPQAPTKCPENGQLSFSVSYSPDLGTDPDSIVVTGPNFYHHLDQSGARALMLSVPPGVYQIDVYDAAICNYASFSCEVPDAGESIVITGTVSPPLLCPKTHPGADTLIRVQFDLLPPGQTLAFVNWSGPGGFIEQHVFGAVVGSDSLTVNAPGIYTAELYTAFPPNHEQCAQTTVTLEVTEEACPPDCAFEMLYLDTVLNLECDGSYDYDLSAKFYNNGCIVDTLSNGYISYIQVYDQSYNKIYYLDSTSGSQCVSLENLQPGTYTIYLGSYIYNPLYGYYQDLCQDQRLIELPERSLPVYTIQVASWGTACNADTGRAKVIAVFKDGIPVPPENYQYEWRRSILLLSETTNCIDNLGVGLYQVTLIDENGCAVALANVDIPDLNPVSFEPLWVTPANNCGECDGVVILPKNNGGPPDYNHYMTDGDGNSHFPAPGTSNQFTGLCPGDYHVITYYSISDTVCPALYTVNVPISDEGLTLSLDPEEGSPCIETDARIFFEITGGESPYDVYLKDEYGVVLQSIANLLGTTGQFAGLPAGNYIVEVISQGSDYPTCRTEEAITLEEPNIHLGAEHFVVQANSCSGECNAQISVPNLLEGNQIMTIRDQFNNLLGVYNASSASPIVLSGLKQGVYLVRISGGTGLLACDQYFSIDIEDPDPVQFALQIQDPQDCKGNGGAIAVIPSGGTAPYNISWNTGHSGFALTDLAVGTYFFSVTDANGCSAEGSAELNVPGCIIPCPEFVVESYMRDAICGRNDGYAEVVVKLYPDDYTYQWDDGFAGTVRDSLAPGQYSVTVTSKARPECSQVQEVLIGASGGPLLGGETDYITGCGLQVLVSLTVSGGTPPYMISYSGSQNGNAVLAAAGSFDLLAGAGILLFTVEDAQGCTDLYSMHVETEVNSFGLLTTIAAYPNCSNSNGAISASASGTAPYAFYLNGQLHGISFDGNYVYTGLNEGLYLIEVQDANGCLARDTVALVNGLGTALDPDIFQLQDGSCSNGVGSIQFDGSGDSDLQIEIIQYGGNVPLYQLTGDQAVSFPLLPGFYYLRVIDENGCTEILENIEIGTVPDLDFHVLPREPECTFEFRSGSIAIDPDLLWGDGVQYAIYTSGGSLIAEGLQADSLQPGDYIVRAVYADRNGEMCSAEVPVTLGEPECIDLALRKRIQLPKPTYRKGDTVTFEITLYNQGAGTADSIKVTDFVADGYVFDPANYAANPSWAFDGLKACAVYPDPLGPGDSAVLYLKLIIGNALNRNFLNVAEITTAYVGGSPVDSDSDSYFDDEPGNDSGGVPEGETDDVVDGDGSGAPGDDDPDRDEDDHDISLLMVCGEMACNDKIHLGLDTNCIGILQPGMFVSPKNYPDSIYRLAVRDERGVPHSDTFTAADLGKEFIVSVFVDACRNSCWSRVLIEDKLGPQIFCENDTLDCTDDLSSVPDPIAYDACGIAKIKKLSEQITDLDCDPEFLRKVTQVWTATDAYGNTGDTCTRVICIRRFDWAGLLPPANVHIDCKNVQYDVNGAIDPAQSGVPTYHGEDLPAGSYLGCGIVVLFQDQDIATNPCKHKVLRTWYVTEWWCNDFIQWTWQQWIVVQDTTGPVLEETLDDLVVNTTPWACHAAFVPEQVAVHDDCNTVTRVVVSYGTQVIENYQGALWLDPGLHKVSYEFYDACGNVTEETRLVEVKDLTPPVAVCDFKTVVNLTNGPGTRVPASSFDDGSHDNCLLDHFEVRRMNDFACGNLSDWAGYVDFCCEDVGKSILVSVKVVDASGNENTCMVVVEVQDKTRPGLSCPPDIRIACDYPYDPGNLHHFGKVVDDVSAVDPIVLNPLFWHQINGAAKDGLAYDNCPVIIEEENDLSGLNNCGIGTIVRKFEATDGSGNSSTCWQHIEIVQPVAFSEANIRWPLDITVADLCDTAHLEPDDLQDPYDRPHISGHPCAKAGISHSDEVFRFAQDNNACFKILRTWSVLNWCDTARTLVVYKHVQIIKSINTVKPVLVEGLTDSVWCDYGADCERAKVSFHFRAEDQCTPDELLTYSFRVDFNRDGSIDRSYSDVGRGELSDTWIYGSHLLYWSIGDQCGNVLEGSAPISVRNCAPPLIYCRNGVSTSLQAMDLNGDGTPDTCMVVIWASDIDGGSTHACGGKLKYSFSADTTDTSRTFGCNDVGDQTVNLWVTADNGAQSNCQTFVRILDPSGCCPAGAAYDITGAIRTETGKNLAGVKVSLESCNYPSVTTDAKGEFIFHDIRSGAACNIAPFRNNDWLNGVTTADIVRIQRHILGLEKIQTPYRLIAADADRSGYLSTRDVSQLRRLILGVIDAIPENTSFRFVPTEYAFADPENPFGASFPEQFAFNKLSEPLSVGFYGIKTGDVNDSYAPGTQAAGRQGGYLKLLATWETDEVNGRTVLHLTGQNLHEYASAQFTLQFDPREMPFHSIQYQPGHGLNEDNVNALRASKGFITVSWNGDAPPNTELFSLVFEATSVKHRNANVVLNSEITPALALNKRTSTEQGIQMDYRSGEERLADDFSIEPNPWNHWTDIAISAGADDLVEMSIYDTRGKIAYRTVEAVSKGTHKVRLDRTLLPQAGLYYVQLDFKNRSLTKSMVVSE